MAAVSAQSRARPHTQAAAAAAGEDSCCDDADGDEDGDAAAGDDVDYSECHVYVAHLIATVLSPLIYTLSLSFVCRASRTLNRT